MNQVNNTAIDISTKWLGISIKNPLVLAALTPISHKRITEHIGYYKRISETGIGAIITESFMPHKFGNDQFAYSQHDLVAIESGLLPEQYMGCSIAGPPYPNLASILYGENLIKQLKQEIAETPIIGSLIANYGTKSALVDAAMYLLNAGVSALELNFSCPNIIAPYIVNKNKDAYRKLPSYGIIKAVRDKTGLPISLKITPNYKLSNIVKNKIIECIDNISYSNAHLGLVGPKLTAPFGSKFGRSNAWSYTGIYGPFERNLLYAAIARIKKNQTYNKIQLSVAGGLVSEEQIIEALLLGANTVQLASAILWKGLGFVESSIRSLKQFMHKNNFTKISDFVGLSLSMVMDSISEVSDYSYNTSGKPVNQRKPMKITEKCTNCFYCLDRCCLAIQKVNNTHVTILPDLCSGCGWCKKICPITDAIDNTK